MNANGAWTPDIATAAEFSSIDDASKFYSNHGFGPFEAHVVPYLKGLSIETITRPLIPRPCPLDEDF